MSISSTVQKFMLYIKEGGDYFLYRLSSQGVEMNDGTTLEQKVQSLNSLIGSKVDKEDVVNDVLTTEEGFVLDARQGKALKDDINELNNKLGENYIVEEGSNSNGKYRKWSDGTLEMWHSGNATCAIGTAAGSIYMSSEFTLTFPVASKTACFPVMSIIANGAIWGSASSSANSYRTSFKYRLMAATTWNLASFSYSYYARGTWK